MGIAKRNPITTVPNAPQLPIGKVLAEKEIYKTAAADSFIQPPESLVVYMEGMPWKLISYYSQLLDQDDDIREVDIGQSAALQQYRQIKDLEIRLQGSLETSYDEDTSRNEINGTAIAVGCIPNRYDYFTADLSSSVGLFMVNSSTRKTYNNKSVYEISFTAVGYIDSGATKDRYEALEARTVKTFYFHKDRVILNQTPLLTTEEHGLSYSLRQAYVSLAKQFLNAFRNPNDRLLIVPDEDYHVYDARFGDFVFRTIDTILVPEMRTVNRVSIDREPNLKSTSLFDVLIDCDPSQLPYVTPKAGVVPRSFFSISSFLASTNCWKVDYYVYPDVTDAASPDFMITSHSSYQSTSLISHPLVLDASTAFFNSEDNSYLVDGDVIPIIHLVHADPYYVFSENFYLKTNSRSFFELQVWKYLEGQPLDSAALMVLANKWKCWPRLEQFYYAPILLMLIKSAVAEFY